VESADPLRDFERAAAVVPAAPEDSFADWDMRDGTADWTDEALAANANVFLDDFLLFDITKPITDQSHLEIEKSTLYGRPYQTGGGRTIDANVIDILLTWLVNHDREFLQGGATGATKPGMNVFPYFATPNTEPQTVAESIELAPDPDIVWSLIGQFNLDWHPLVASVRLTGTGIGQLRTIRTRDGKEIVERLEAVDDAKRFYRYSQVAGLPRPITPAWSKSSRRAAAALSIGACNFSPIVNPTLSCGPGY
jgi:hypothetical protein